MPGPLLKEPEPLRPSYPSRAYRILKQEADDAAAEEYNQSLLETTRLPLPELKIPIHEEFLASTNRPGIERRPVQGASVFDSPEEFARIQREAANLADPTLLGPSTLNRPGFRSSSTFNIITPPGFKTPEMLTAVRSNATNSNDIRKSWREAIASIESRGSGDYKAVGPTDDKLGRALGRYQVMEANVGPWSKAALGRELTPEEFLADPESQDIIFDHIFGQYVEQFGSAEKAAQAWFGGAGGVGTERKDVLGTSVSEYGSKFEKALR